MYRVEIRKPDPGRSTIPDFDPADSFFRVAESDEMLEDLRRIFGDRIIAVTTLADEKDNPRP